MPSASEKITLRELGLMVRGKRGARSLRQVGELIGVSASTLMRFEGGETPDVRSLLKIINWLGVPISRIEEDEQ